MLLKFYSFLFLLIHNFKMQLNIYISGGKMDYISFLLQNLPWLFVEQPLLGDYTGLTRPSVIWAIPSPPAPSSPPSRTLHLLLLFLEALLTSLCLHPWSASGLSLITSFPGKPFRVRVTGSTAPNASAAALHREGSSGKRSPSLWTWWPCSRTTTQNLSFILTQSWLWKHSAMQLCLSFSAALCLQVW